MDGQRREMGRGIGATASWSELRVSEVDVQRRIARLEGLLTRVLQRRGQTRGAGVPPENGMAAARPATLPPRAVDDEVVDLLDDDIVEIRDSAPPSGAIAARPATAPPSVQPPHFAEPPPVVEPLALDQFPIEAESH